MTSFSATEPFDRKQHPVDEFDSGQPTLDRWLKQYAGQGQRRDTARTFVSTADDGAVTGYYTLLASQVEHQAATRAVSAGTTTRYPIPICLLARLAVNREDQGRGLGAELLLDALQRTVRASREIAIRAVVAHAIDDEAAGFYGRFSFVAASDEPRTLMVPLEAVRTVLRAQT